MTETLLFLILIGLGLLVGRILLEVELKRVDVAKSADSPYLRPVELSYLASGGDLSDALAVLAVDLVQRVIKSDASAAANPKLLDYEEKLWLVTKKYVSESAKEIVDGVNPDRLFSDPLAYWRRVSALYQLLRELLRSFFNEVLRDPRRLRKYFSLNWISRLILEFSSAGYQDRLRENMSDHLTERGLLVSKEKRIKRASAFFAIACATFALVVLLVGLDKGFFASLIMLSSAFVTASVLKASIYCAGYIPLYGELSNLLRHVTRSGWRLRSIRALLIMIKVLAISALIFVFVSGSLTGWLASAVVSHNIDLKNLYVEFALVLISFFSLDTAFRGVDIRNNDVATSFGESQVLRVRRRLAEMGPLDAFRAVLVGETYDPSFSEIVALYGIGPLFFLA